MDGQSYGIQWIRQYVPGGDIKSSGSLFLETHQALGDDIMENSAIAISSSDSGYIVEDDVDCVRDEANIDQIAAENLIFMARDGRMVQDMISTADHQGSIVVSAAEVPNLDDVMHQVSGISAVVRQEHEDAGGGISNYCEIMEDYTETTPQMVTEEVITDDWVQHQGEERVIISAEQIIGTASNSLLDVEVPLPTVQDEYTAQRPYPCDFCSRRFRKKVTLMNHMVAHQNDRPHLCRLCETRFFRRSDLIDHLKAHALTDPNFDTHENQTQQTQIMKINDHFYDQNFVPEAKPSYKSLKLRSSTSSAKISGTRKRVSRIKPKEGISEPREIFDAPEPQSTSSDVFTTKIKKEQSNPYPIIDDSKPFVCQQCGLAFARQKALQSHVKNHRNESPFECNECNELFWDAGSLQDHQKTHTFEESNSEYEPADEEDTRSESESEQLYGDFYCHECGMGFHRHDVLQRHKKMHVKTCDNYEDEDVKDRHCCNTCGETFAEALDLLAHAEIHARYPPFKCILCGESFFEETMIKRHLEELHSNDMTSNSCILCGKACRDRRALIKHAWDHSREKCYSCSKCGKNFHNKARLKRHMASHRDKSVICEICNEEFPDGRTLSNHRHSHSATSSGKLFPCEECGKTFGSRSSQQIHVRIHTGERPYGCRFCWKAFADGGTLRKHERIHTGEKPYGCSVCPRAFNQRVVLREHIRSHHSAKDEKRGTYYCSVCSTDLSSSNDLIQHLIKHSDATTAMKRQPITGPRKYKRRRKLKPHEIERLREQYKQNSNGSDLDISEIDIGSAEEFLKIAELGNKKNKRRGAQKAETGKDNKESSSFNINDELNNSVDTIIDVGDEFDRRQVEDEHIVVTDNQNESKKKKKRFNSTSSNSDKLWQTRIMSSNEELCKSLFTNMEDTLQSIDSLVVGNERLKFAKSESTKESTIQRFSQSERIIKGQKPSTNVNGVSKSRRGSKNTVRQGPRMIYTEKNRNVVPEGNKRRGKISVNRSEIHSMDIMPNSSISMRRTLADDYEIMSPDAKPPNQISSSPMHIKQEHDHNGRGSDCIFYDAHLLLEASSLRKEAFEKFNPSIVNDLEEILRSPIKSSNNRHRFTSESSTHFLSERSMEEEDRNLIKIEPTSPDLHEIVETAGTNTVTSITNEYENSSLLPTERRSSRNRLVTANRKYINFQTTDSIVANEKHSNYQGGKLKLMKSAVKELSMSEITFQSFSLESTKSTKSDLSSSIVSDSTDTNLSSSTSSAAACRALDSSYSALSAVVAAADAVATSSTFTPTSEKKKRCFECEMCSLVFTDRAQLLDHVPIHI